MKGHDQSQRVWTKKTHMRLRMVVLTGVSALIVSGMMALMGWERDRNAAASDSSGAMVAVDGHDEERVAVSIAVIYVDKNAVGVGDGASWEDAFFDLSAALEYERLLDVEDDEVWVKGYGPGEPYRVTTHGAVTRPGKSTSRTIRLHEGLRLHGGFAGTERVKKQRATHTINGRVLYDPIHWTVLDGYDQEGLSKNNYVQHVVTGADDCLFEGFVVRNGNAQGKTWPDDRGGGIQCVSVSPVVRNCIFIDNAASANGGAVHNFNSSPLFENCLFGLRSPAQVELNLLNDGALEGIGDGGNHAGSQGGAIWNDPTSAPIFRGCSFIANHVGLVGNPLSGADPATGNPSFGGAVYNRGGAAHYDDCLFMGNHVSGPGDGGAIYTMGVDESDGVVTIEACTFVANRAVAFARFEGPLSDAHELLELHHGLGGAICNEATSPIIFDCVFGGDHEWMANTTSSNGGAIYNANGSSPKLVRCSFLRNKALLRGGAVFNAGPMTMATFDNCTFASNVASYGGAVYNVGSRPTFNDCQFDGNVASVVRVADLTEKLDGLALIVEPVHAPRAAARLNLMESFGARGACVYNDDAFPMFAGCTFQWHSSSCRDHDGNPVGTVERQAATAGGVMYCGSNPSTAERACVAEDESHGGNGTLSLVDCEFYNNSASERGGCLYVSENYTVSVTGCTFGSPSDDPNGPVRANGAGPRMAQHGSIAQSRDLNAYGGVVYNSGGTVTLSACDFHFNSAGPTEGVTGEAHGGVVYSDDGTVTIEKGCSFVGNHTFNADYHSQSCGGVLYAINGTRVELHDSTFFRNFTRSNFETIGGPSTSESIGGVLYMDSCESLNVVGCDFVENFTYTFPGANTHAASGALELNDVTRTVIDDTLFAFNGAGRDGVPATTLEAGCGGAISIVIPSGTSLTIVNSVFDSNVASRAAAVDIFGTTSGIGSSSIDHCTFRGNIAGRSGAIDHPTGVSFREKNDIRHSVFEGNHSIGNAGAVTGCRLFDCRLTENEAGYVYEVPDVLRDLVAPYETNLNANGGATAWCDLYDCVVEGNVAANDAGGSWKGDFISGSVYRFNGASGDGGAVLAGRDQLFVNDVFFNNTAHDDGGAIKTGVDVFLYHCSFTGNVSSFSGALSYDNDCLVTLRNCILWGNRSRGRADSFDSLHELVADQAAETVKYCLIRGRKNTDDHEDDGNLGELAEHDPLFVDPSGGNLRLRWNGAAIDAGTWDSAVTDQIPVDDIDGNARPKGGGIDMGAYEHMGDVPKLMVVGNDVEIVDGKVVPVADDGAFIGEHSPIIATGKVRAATRDTVQLGFNSSALNDRYVGYYLRIIQGTGKDQLRKIESYAGLSHTAILVDDWDVVPAVGSLYKLYLAGTFVIKNIGVRDLEFSGKSSVCLSDTHDFWVLEQPAKSLASGAMTDVVIGFSPRKGTARDRNVVAFFECNDDDVLNGEGDAPTFTLAIHGSAGSDDPRVTVTDLDGNEIGQADMNLTAANATDFGKVDGRDGSCVRTFSIRNVGDFPVTLAGDASNYVTISGDVDDFAVTMQPTTGVLEAGHAVTVEVMFRPTEMGTRVAMVRMRTDDPDDTRFHFVIEGEGSGPVISVHGHGHPIANVDALTDVGRIDAIVANLPTDGATTITIIFQNAVTPKPTGTLFLQNEAGDAKVVPYATAKSMGETTVEFTVPKVLDWTMNPSDVGAIYQESGVDTPRTVNDTQFGIVDTTSMNGVIKYYTIVNNGTETLNVTGSPTVKIYDVTDFRDRNDGLWPVTYGSLSESPDFRIHWLPADSLPMGTSTTLAMQYSPSDSDTHSAVVCNATDDRDFTFRVEGTSKMMNSAPVAVAYVNDFKSMTEIPDTITHILMSASGSHDPDGDIASIRWDVRRDDGTVIYDKTFAMNPHERFLTRIDPQADPAWATANWAEGIYMATLTVTDNDPIQPKSDSAEVMIYVGKVLIMEMPEKINEGRGAQLHGGKVRIANGTVAVADTVIDLSSDNPLITFPMSRITIEARRNHQAFDFVVHSDDDVTHDVVTISAACASIVDNDVRTTIVDDDVPIMSLLGNGIVVERDDATPSAADNTHLGIVYDDGDDGGVLTRTFEIRNAGTTDIVLSPTSSGSYVGIKGENADDFSVSVQPMQVINPGKTTSFVVEFRPQTVSPNVGDRCAEVVIAESTGVLADYAFIIKATRGAGPEIGLYGNAHSIDDGGIAPYIGNLTDFGTVAVNRPGLHDSTVTHLFSIRNLGGSSLTLTGDRPNDIVLLTGNGHSEFVIDKMPNQVIAPAQASTFSITFKPRERGVRTAWVVIPNTDDDEGPYTFMIQGTGEKLSDGLGDDDLIEADVIAETDGSSARGVPDDLSTTAGLSEAGASGSSCSMALGASRAGWLPMLLTFIGLVGLRLHQRRFSN